VGCFGPSILLYDTPLPSPIFNKLDLYDGGTVTGDDLDDVWFILVNVVLVDAVFDISVRALGHSAIVQENHSLHHPLTQKENKTESNIHEVDDAWKMRPTRRHDLTKKTQINH
jgi:hypothetical protein